MHLYTMAEVLVKPVEAAVLFALQLRDSTSDICMQAFSEICWNTFLQTIPPCNAEWHTQMDVT